MLAVAWLVCCLSAPPETWGLDNPGFEQVTPQGWPRGWQHGRGAGAGEPPVSAFSVREEEGVDRSRALRLSGDRQTQTWQSLHARPLPVQEGELLELTAQARGEDMRLESGQFGDSNVGLKFLDERSHPIAVGPSPVLAPADTRVGATWTRQVRAVQAPPGAAYVQPFVFLSMTGTVWFDNLELVRLPAPPWRESSTEHFHFRRPAALEETHIDDEEAERLLVVYAQRTGLLLAGTIEYVQYASLSEKEALTGLRTNGHADENAVHSLWAVDEHEMAHVLVLREHGRSPFGALTEGIAVSLQGDWQGQGLGQAARRVLAAHPELEVSAVVGDKDQFYARSDLLTYPLAGSFVNAYVARCGYDRFFELYRSGFGEVAGACGTGLEELTGLWLEELRR
jgi:hypothetical protein